MRRRDLSSALFVALSGSTAAGTEQPDQPASSPFPPTDAEAAARVTAVNPAYPPGDLRRYGAIAQAGDNSTALASALAQAQAGGATIYVPPGTWKYAKAPAVTRGSVSFRGDGYLVSILQKTSDIVGLAVTDGGSLALADMQLKGSGKDSCDGLQINSTGYARLSSVALMNHGRHGLNVLQADVRYFGDLIAAFNRGDGVRLSGSGRIQANANTFVNINCISNGGWGFNCLVANANFGHGLVLQQNVAGGINLDTCKGNTLAIYCESNTGPDINFTAKCAAPNYGGNLLFVTYSDHEPTFNGRSSEVNTVQRNRAGPVLKPGFSRIFADRLVFGNSRVDGTMPEGSFMMHHASSRQLDVTADDVDANQLTRYSNAKRPYLHGLQADNLGAAAEASSWGPGVLSIGNGVAESATAGSAAALPAAPAGYLTFVLGSTVIKVPYYNT
jgi:hypothetical protein